MKPRAGVTLLEVLVAILLCSVGLLALLTLFPLGAMEMAQAVKDDICGHVKHNSASVANIFGIRGDIVVGEAMIDPSQAPFGGNLRRLEIVPPDPDDPPDPSFFDEDIRGVSYPVFVDPIGFNANMTQPSFRDWVAGAVGMTPRRVSFEPLDPLPTPLDPNRQVSPNLSRDIRRWCCFLDNINFRTDDVFEPFLGLAAPPNVPVERTLRYSYAYLLQRRPVGLGVGDDPVRATGPVHVTIVVYSGRSLEDWGVGETAYQNAFFDPLASTIEFRWSTGSGQTPPDLQVGNWLLDGTMTSDSTVRPVARFHRVVAIEPLPADPNTGEDRLRVEVQTPPSHRGPGTVVVMENVVEVFDRGTN